MSKTNAEYSRIQYAKYYKKELSHVVCKIKFRNTKILSQEYIKWQSVFEYIYRLWDSGVGMLYTENFFKGMKLKDFRKVWTDRKDIVDNLYSQLQKFNSADKIC